MTSLWQLLLKIWNILWRNWMFWTLEISAMKSYLNWNPCQNSDCLIMRKQVIKSLKIWESIFPTWKFAKVESLLHCQNQTCHQKAKYGKFLRQITSIVSKMYCLTRTKLISIRQTLLKKTSCFGPKNALQKKIMCFNKIS